MDSFKLELTCYCVYYSIRFAEERGYSISWRNGFYHQNTDSSNCLCLIISFSIYFCFLQTYFSPIFWVKGVFSWTLVCLILKHPPRIHSLRHLWKSYPLCSVRSKGERAQQGQNNDFAISAPLVAHHWPSNSQGAPRASWPLDTVCPAQFMYILLVIPWSEHTKRVYLTIKSNRT